VPDSVLREVEKMYQDDAEKLNNGFNNFDECSGKSTF